MGNDLEKQELLDGDRWIIPGNKGELTRKHNELLVHAG